MTDLVALPKPRFTNRETASIGPADWKCYGGIKSRGCRLDHFAMTALGANHNSHPRGKLEATAHLRGTS